MSGKSPKKISSFFDSSSYLEPLEKLEDLIGEILVVESFETRKGQFGDYVVMNCSDVETGVTRKVSTGAMAITAALKQADAQRAFPFVAKVEKSNRMIIFVDPD